MRMKILCRAWPLVLVAALQSGCATQHVIKTHGMVKESFYGLGPVHQKEDMIYVQGITQKFRQNHKSEQWPSYVMLTVTSNRVVKTEWVNPGELSGESLVGPQLPYQRDDYRGAQERFADFCKTQPVAKYYGGNWILIRNPDKPDRPNQFGISPSRCYRAKSSYPTYCLALTGSVLFDIVTSPFQLVGAIIINESFQDVY